MRVFAIALGCLVCLFAAGCCMCAAPYDYCAPTFTGQAGEDCRPHARVNSAFSYGSTCCEPTPVTGQMPPEVEGSGELPTAAVPPQRPAPMAPPSNYGAQRPRGTW